MKLPAIGNRAPKGIGDKGHQRWNATNPADLCATPTMMLQIDIQKRGNRTNGGKVTEVVHLDDDQTLA